jgi:hypothetical protein
VKLSYFEKAQRQIAVLVGRGPQLHSGAPNRIARRNVNRPTAKVFRNSWTVIAPKVVSRNPEEINVGRY